MTHPCKAQAARFNSAVVEEFRANGGQVNGPLASTPLVLLHHIGARSGIERVTPLAYLPHRDGQLLVVASDEGSPTHPAWYHNLKAHPNVTVELGGEIFRVVATELDLVVRAALWPTIVTQAPTAGEYQRKTSRTFPVFLLTRERRQESRGNE